VTAWLARQSGQGGAHLDMSQRELTSYLCGEAFVAAGAGHAPQRRGNAQPPHRVQNCYRSSDVDRWVAVTVDDTQCGTLAQLLGVAPDDADLEVRLGRFIAARTTADSVAALMQAGIAAAPAATGSDVLRQRGIVWDQALQNSPQGALVKGFPMQFDREPMTITREAPVLGADSDDILRRVGGLSDDEIANLRTLGIV
jgi:crotonobetainyl-CoA:carnitine CoA-transferase CaiB-like acyl-CoA transferase